MTNRAAAIIGTILLSLAVVVVFLDATGHAAAQLPETKPPAYTPRNTAISQTTNYIWGNSPDRAIVPDRVIPEPTAAPESYYTIHYLLLPGNAIASVQMTVTAGDVMVGFMLVIVFAVLLVNTAALIKGGNRG